LISVTDWKGPVTSGSTHYTGTTVPDQTVNYTTTSAGKVASITGQGSTTSYTWDGQGRLAGVDDTVAGDFGFAYDCDDAGVLVRSG
jgi:YD repeat-containing protein